MVATSLSRLMLTTVKPWSQWSFQMKTLFCRQWQLTIAVNPRLLLWLGSSRIMTISKRLYWVDNSQIISHSNPRDYNKIIKMLYRHKGGVPLKSIHGRDTIHRKELVCSLMSSNRQAPRSIAISYQRDTFKITMKIRILGRETNRGITNHKIQAKWEAT